ncbi:hypothetical protein C7N43_23400 [Sphingobacteriales bacterium UPWRP_1]|nr:hypothetical protein B6N25_15530 [Sphingobacteriales bacterium TSM_CSS]PSJ74528.1 hypothetical protein C7N43_23400 [Sphingobacteriales bacterium UPWRP_1]
MFFKVFTNCKWQLLVLDFLNKWVKTVRTEDFLLFLQKTPFRYGCFKLFCSFSRTYSLVTKLLKNSATYAKKNRT